MLPNASRGTTLEHRAANAIRKLGNKVEELSKETRATKYETVELRLKLVWQPWETLVSLPTTLQERKALFARYPTGLALYRMRFTDSKERLVSYLGETEKGFGGAGGRVDMHTRDETEKFRHYDLQREVKAALQGKRPITIDSLHLTSSISINEGGVVIKSRPINLESADERLMLESLLALVECELGRVTLNAAKKNRSERGSKTPKPV